MLSSIGRAAIKRVGAGASHKSTNRVLQTILHLQRVARSNNVGSTYNLCQSSLSLLRSYATATLAAKTKTKTSAATTKPKTKKAAPKKPVKKAVKRKPKRKVAAKPKPKAKPKKKILTPKGKERAAKQKQIAELKALKAAALTPPKHKAITAWNVLLHETMAKKTMTAGGIGLVTKEASAKFKALTAEELEVRDEFPNQSPIILTIFSQHYNHIANQNKAEYEIEYKKFIDSHKPDEIRLANNARAQLAKKGRKNGSTKPSSLRDPRIPRQPRSAWVFFTKDRWSSGDLKGMKVPEAAPLISREWKDMSPTQRKVSHPHFCILPKLMLSSLTKISRQLN